MEFNIGKCERYVLIKCWVLLGRVKSIALAKWWLINNNYIFYYIMVLWCFSYSISISLLVYELDKLTIWGCFGNLALYLLLNKLNTKQVFVNRFAFDTGHVKLLWTEWGRDFVNGEWGKGGRCRKPLKVLTVEVIYWFWTCFSHIPKRAKTNEDI